MKLFPLLSLALASADKKSDERDVASSVRTKGLEVLFDQVELDKNAVMSPLSVIGCMYMLAAGAVGESRREILDAMGFERVFGDEGAEISDPFIAYTDIIQSLTEQNEMGYTLNIANGMFYQKDMPDFTPNELDPKYFDLLQEKFIKDVSNIEEVDFATQPEQATDIINEWIRKQTQDKIPKLFKTPLTSDSLVVLASSLYFKASWELKFNIMSEQKANEFCWTTTVQDLLNSNCEESITWMYKEESVPFTKFKKFANNDVTVFEMPLKNSRASTGPNIKMMMQIWFPEQMITSEENDLSLRQFIRENIGGVRKKLSQKKLARIIMPKLSLDFDQDITKSLKAIGIEQVFDQQSADLSPMLGDDNNGFVKKVNHAVKFELDENGVEGAAVTTVLISSRTFSQPNVILLNKPFYFVISNRCWSKNDSGSRVQCPYGNVPIFFGRVVHPSN